MASISLKINIVEFSMVKTIAFDPSNTVYDACRLIRERIPEFAANPTDYGLFFYDEDQTKGIWLEPNRTLDFYLLRNGDSLEYKKKSRIVKVRMLDDAVKAVVIDDSYTVAQLMLTICLKIGITNHEEYSLVRELPEEERMKTLTMKRDKSIAKDQKKLDEMKKRLHTDDELDWLDHGKTLREQGIVDEKETLLLRRKYFFSDQNIDARDPVQLNLLYVQMRDAILKGAHPVKQEEAIKFAGYQCQIQFGDHNESKHKAGFIELKEFLPKEYCKVKGIEKKIYQEHRQFVCLSEVEAKAKYTQLARSLKTYGVTFFLVKEKVKGKNKLVPRLLGITKESVVRVDENTKETLKEWKLTTVRRWAASPNSFTLDFGDYADSYYAVQTVEGEQIAQLISGYIDIIMKKQQAKDYLGTEGDDESMMYEDSVVSSKATIVQHQTANIGRSELGSVALPAVLRAGDTGQGQFSMGSMQAAQFSRSSQQAHIGHRLSSTQSSQLHALGNAQRALFGTISEGLEAVGEAQNALDHSDSTPQIGSDPAARKWLEGMLDLSRQKLNAELSAMNAAAAQVVNWTFVGPENMDYVAVGSSMQAISSNLIEFSQDVRTLASLDKSVRGPLMDAARNLASAFSDLLNAAKPDSAQSRQVLLNAAARIGECSTDVMVCIEADSDLEKEFKDRLRNLAKAVASSTAGLVLAAKNVSASCSSAQEQNSVIGSATQCAMATSQLIACSKVLASTVSSSPECQDQFAEAVKQVSSFVDGVVNTAQDVCNNDDVLSKLHAAATQVTRALDELLNHVRSGSAGLVSSQLEDVKSVMVASERLFACVGDPAELVRQTLLVTKSTSHLVNMLNMEAESATDSDSRSRLLQAAKMLADATANMVEVAKGCAGRGHSEANQEALKRATDELRLATNVAASSCVIQKQTLNNLQQACKRAASAATQLINMSNVASKSNTNSASQSQLNSQSRIVSDNTIPRIVQALRAAILLHPNDDTTPVQAALIEAAQDMIQNGGRLQSAVHAVLPTVSDQSAAFGLGNCSRSMAAALAELSAAIGMIQDIRPPEMIAPQKSVLETSLEQVEMLQNELAGMRQALAEGKLVSLPGETAEKCGAQLGATSKVLGSSMAQLLTAASEGNTEDTGTASRSTMEALKQLLSAARGVAATLPANSTMSPRDVLDSAGDVLEKSLCLMMAAKSAVGDPRNPNNRGHLTQVAKAASMSLNNCVNCLPGLREVDQIVKYVTTVNIKLTTTSQKLPPAKCTVIEARSRLGNRAAELNRTAAEVAAAASSHSTQQVAPASHNFSRAYEEFVESGLEAASAAAAAGDTAVQTEVVSGLRGVSTVAGRLLIAAKSLLVDPGSAETRNQLTLAARAVTESVNQLINVCTVSAAPGEKECDAALRQIQTIRPLLDNPSQSVVDATYFDCFDHVTDKARVLAESMTGVSAGAKQGAMPAFCSAITGVAEAVCGIAENAAQAAYLVGVADPGSTPGRPGLVDQTQIAKSMEAIQAACQTISDNTCAQPQVIAALSTIARQTAAICNACRVASDKTDNATTKRNFVQMAKDIANGTAALVQAVKSLDGALTDENRRRCAEAAKPLLHALEMLNTIAASPEYAGVPASVSEKGRLAQQPITLATRALVDGAVTMVDAAKKLAANPRDPSTHHTYAAQTHTLSEAIKAVVSAIRDSAPGQRECDSALQSIDSWINILDQASLAAVGQNLIPTQDGSLSGYQEQVMASARQLLNQVEPIRNAAKGQAPNLDHYVLSAAGYMEPLTSATVGCASRTVNSKLQSTLLDQTKTVIEAMQNLMMTVKTAAGNKKAVQTFAAVDEAADGAKETLHEMIETLEAAAASSGLVTSLVQNLTQAVSKVTTGNANGALPPDAEAPSYVECQTNIVKLSKQVAQTVQEMMNKSVTNVQDLGTLANTLTHSYNALATESCRITLACPSSQVAVRIKSAIQQLGTSCIELVQDAGSLQSNPNAGYTKRDIAVHSRKVLEYVSEVVLSVQSGSRGTQACINAAGAIDGIVADLDTTIMFASAGTLSPDPGETFGNHREGILKTAKELVDGAKQLVAGAANNQEQLMAAASRVSDIIARLAECVKHGATALGSHQPDAQVLLINAAKDVAHALSQMIESAKNASGKQATDPSMAVLKESAKIVVTNVTSLLKTVKIVEDAAARGTQALESSIEAISQEMKVAVSTDRSEQRITPDDLIRLTRPITLATARAVAAGNSGLQDDIIAAANMGRKAVSDLLRGCRCSLVGVTDQTLAPLNIQATGQKCATSYRELLRQCYVIVNGSSSTENKQQLVVISKQVASAVAELVHSVDTLRGSDWVDPCDPTVIAENELLSAASSIEAAAKKLAQLQPRQRPRQADETLNFEEQILEAAKSIAAATAALVKAASVAQKELVAEGRIGTVTADIDEESQWSQGLVSAARLVAVATHSLCDAANAMVQGQASEEKLISSAKQVAASTAQLLLACKVKADPNSKAMQRLQNAGNAVKRATEALVREAQTRSKDSVDGDDVDGEVGVSAAGGNRRMVSDMAQVIKAQEEILRKERELEAARQKLKHIRMAQYQASPGTDSPPPF